MRMKRPKNIQDCLDLVLFNYKERDLSLEESIKQAKKFLNAKKVMKDRMSCKE